MHHMAVFKPGLNGLRANAVTVIDSLMHGQFDTPRLLNVYIRAGLMRYFGLSIGPEPPGTNVGSVVNTILSAKKLSSRTHRLNVWVPGVLTIIAANKTVFVWLSHTKTLSGLNGLMAAALAMALPSRTAYTESAPEFAPKPGTHTL